MTEIERTERNKAIAWLDMKPEHFGRYKICKEGQILSLKKNKPLSPGLGRNGYYHVELHSDLRIKTHSVHRLIAEYFLSDYSPELEVNHKDGNKLNNHADNLEMVTRSQNINHGFENGLIVPPWKGKTGKLHHASKAVVQLSKEGEFIAEHGSIREAAKKMGLSPRTIDQVLAGKGKTAGGFKWKYKE
jgi:hypothetical protein